MFYKSLKYIACLLTLLLCFTAGAQTLTETQKLAATAKIWGFLKYYHPQVATGKYNWDYKLVQVLPLVKQAQTKEQLSKVYLTWIDEQGEVSVCKKCAKNTTEHFDKNFNMSWMEDAGLFTPQLTAKLKYIENNRLLGDKYYVSAKGNRGSLGITNEVSYNNFEYPQEEGRLLTLFRFWNAVEYFFPHKYITDIKWDDILTLSIPKIINAKNKNEYQLALTEITAYTNDSHSYLQADVSELIYGYNRVPFLTTFLEGKTVVSKINNDSLCRKNDIRLGDIITHKDGRLLTDVFKEKEKYFSASNEAVKNRIRHALLYNNTSFVTITFERDGITAEKQIDLYTPQELTYDTNTKDKGYKILEDDIGYANLNILEAKNINTMIATFSKCKTIIFDVRNYPQYIVYELCAKFTPEDKEFVKYLIADLDYPGKFKWQEISPIKSAGKNTFNGKVIVLVNELTQSRSEFTVMGLQAVANTTIVGSQTAGADGESIEVPLPGDFRASFTGNGVFYPDGTQTQRIGIVPDVEIRPTVAGIKAGKDEVLEKAMEVAKQ